jgi:hypothetical protein
MYTLAPRKQLPLHRVKVRERCRYLLPLCNRADMTSSLLDRRGSKVMSHGSKTEVRAHDYMTKKGKTRYGYYVP